MHSTVLNMNGLYMCVIVGAQWLVASGSANVSNYSGTGINSRSTFSIVYQLVSSFILTLCDKSTYQLAVVGMY